MKRVSDSDRKHMHRLGAALDAQQRERRREAGLQPPGTKIEIGLYLSEQLLRTHPAFADERPTFSLPALWRRLHPEALDGGDRSAT